jgi:antitoxin CcdA
MKTEKNAESKYRKRPISLSIRADLIKEAKDLRLNASRAAEAGLEAAIRTAKEKQWLSENADAIKAHNERIARSGTLLKPIWLGG